MTEITILNKKFETAGKYSSSVDLSAETINEAVVHQVMTAYLAGQRQGTASTKTKSMVTGGGKKPFKQKGTGRARQGSSRSPLMVGGAVSHGPQPRCYEQKVNKKVMKKAIQSILADKLQAGKLLVVDMIDSNGKTKELNALLVAKNIKSLTMVTESADSLALRAGRNLKYCTAMPVESFNVYSALRRENIIIEKSALDKLLARIS